MPMISPIYNQSNLNHYRDISHAKQHWRKMTGRSYRDLPQCILRKPPKFQMNTQMRDQLINWIRNNEFDMRSKMV